MAITKSDMTRNLYEKLGLSRRECGDIVDRVFAIIKKNSWSGECHRASCVVEAADCAGVVLLRPAQVARLGDLFRGGRADGSQRVQDLTAKRCGRWGRLTVHVPKVAAGADLRWRR